MVACISSTLSSYSCNVPTPTNFLPSVIPSVVHDHAPPVAYILAPLMLMVYDLVRS